MALRDDKEKTLDQIKQSLMESKFNQEKNTKQLAKLNTYAATTANLSQEQLKAINDQRARLQKSISETGDKIQRLALREKLEQGLGDALSKFLGVDFVKEFFFRLDKNTEVFRKGFKNLADKLGYEKAKKVAGGLFDTLKKLLGVGISLVGILEFIEGWNKADKWFKGNVDWTERLSSGLANLVGSFAGLDDEETKKLAITLNEKIEGIRKFLKEEFSKLIVGLEKAFPEMVKAFDGILDMIGANGEEGTFMGGLGKVSEGVFEASKELWNSDSLLAKALVGFAAIKIGLAAVSAIGTAYTTIVGILNFFGAAITSGGAISAGLAAIGVGGFAVAAGYILAAVSFVGGIINAFSMLPERWEQFKKDWKEADGFTESLVAVIKLVDKILFDIVDGMVKTLTLGNFGLKDIENALAAGDKWIYEKLQKINKDYIQPVFDFISNMFNKIKSWVEEKFGKVAKFFGFDIEPVDPVEAAAQNRKKAEAAKQDNIALGSSSTFEEYGKKLQNLRNNQQISEEQYAKERIEMLQAQSAMGGQRRTANNEAMFNVFKGAQTQVNNQIIATSLPSATATFGSGHN